MVGCQCLGAQAQVRQRARVVVVQPPLDVGSFVAVSVHAQDRVPHQLQAACVSDGVCACVRVCVRSTESGGEIVCACVCVICVVVVCVCGGDGVCGGGVTSVQE